MAKESLPDIVQVAVDKMSFTLGCGVDNKEIESRLENHGAFTKKRLPSKFYECAGYLELSEGDGVPEQEERLLIQYQPRSHVNYFRFEYNPNKLPEEAWQRMRKTVKEIFGDHAKSVLRKSKINRLDIAVDCANVQVQDYFFGTRPYQTTRVYFHEGYPQTLYFGDKLVIYDKKAELEKRGIKVEESSRARIEVRFRNVNCSIAELPEKVDDLLRPFAGVEIYRVSELEAIKQIPPIFIAACHFMGVSAALKRLNANDREVIGNLMEHCNHELLQDPKLRLLAEQALTDVGSMIYRPKKDSVSEDRSSKQKRGKKGAGHKRSTR
jgi:hypothetical protein